jgi:hypothetical protein
LALRKESKQAEKIIQGLQIGGGRSRMPVNFDVTLDKP